MYERYLPCGIIKRDNLYNVIYSEKPKESEIYTQFEVAEENTRNSIQLVFEIESRFSSFSDRGEQKYASKIISFLLHFSHITTNCHNIFIVQD